MIPAGVRRRLYLPAAGAAGLLVPLGMAPWKLWPLTALAPALLLLLLLDATPRQAFTRGWAFGAGMFGLGASWVYVSIHDYGQAPVALAGALTAVFCIGLGLLVALPMAAWARWFRDRRGGILPGFAMAWLFSEWLRTWLLTGFPWLFIGYSQLDAPLSGWAPLIGVLGISLLIALSGTLLVSALRSPKRGWMLAAIAAIWAGGAALKTIEWSSPVGTPLRVAMVQANIPQEFKWAPGYLASTLDTYSELSRPFWDSDLVLWPEAALPAYSDRIEDFLGRMDQQAASRDAALITGVPTRISSPDRARGYAARNSLLALGTASGEYHKRHLVPFGEYVPLEGILRGLIQFFDLPMSSFESGPDEQQPFSVDNVAIAPYICYEIVYPDLVADGAGAAGVLLTVSNDTWFGASAGPLQHLQMAQMRALENARPVIRGTNNGVSALIDERGQLIIRSGQFTREVIRGSVQPQQGVTPFSRTGSWPVIGLMLISLLILRLPTTTSTR